MRRGFGDGSVCLSVYLSIYISIAAYVEEAHSHLVPWDTSREICTAVLADARKEWE